MSRSSKYQIFISSTYEDLKEERMAAIDCVLKLGCFPVCMEYFPAAGMKQMDLITQLIDDCDYMIIISAGIYGSEDPESGKSYTELEYEYALNKDIPVLSFFHNDLEGLPNRYCEKSKEKINKLKKFHGKLKGKLCRPWQDISELKNHISTSLSHAFSMSPRPGWLRADRAGASLSDDVPIGWIGRDRISITLEKPFEEMEFFLQTFKKTENIEESFDGLLKHTRYKLAKAGLIYFINKRDIELNNGSPFKLFCKCKKDDRNEVFSTLCKSDYVVTGRGYDDPEDDNKYIIWFLIPEEPIHLSSRNAWTINQAFFKTGSTKVTF